MILVTGTTGNVGRHVVSQVLRTSAAVHAPTRNPESAVLPGEVEQRIDAIAAERIA